MALNPNEIVNQRLLRLQIFPAVFIFLFTITIPSIAGHGRVMEPPARSSLWRFLEYANNFPEPNYDDNQIWCGGIGVQYEVNGGKCGPCGDAWNEAKPRENEDGGRFGRAIIARTYTPGQTINVAIELTANHLGHFEFNLCPLTFPEEDECFQKYPLFLADGSGTKYMVPRNGTGFYNTTLLLPKDLKCKQCSLRWHYRTANSWNFNTNTTGEVGAGDQEIFRSCSDITIGNFPPVVPRPPTHSIPEEMKPSTSATEAYPDVSISTASTTTTTKPPSTRPSTTVTPKPKPPMVTTTKPKPQIPTTGKPKPSKPSGPSMPTQRPPAPESTTTPKPKPVSTTQPYTTPKPEITQAVTTPQPVTTIATSPTTISSRPPAEKPPSRPGMPMQRPPQEPQSSTAAPMRTHPTMKPPVPFPRLFI